MQIAKGYADRERDRAKWSVYQAWYTAMYYRARRLPALDIVMSKMSGTVKIMTSDQIKSAMKEFGRSREVANG